MGAFNELIGESAAIGALRTEVERLLALASRTHRLPPVLLTGETGTGKGLLARALHRAGPRGTGPLVDVNCAAIPETLLESELFGYERGAFTDARRPKPGLFQAAHQGTLFLDEVGLLPLALQAKLLTVLEERHVRRLGSTRPEPVDVQIVAATSVDLLDARRDQRFREDLYHRLAVVTLSLPPLRERGRDVLLLADHFLARTSGDYGLPARTLNAEARAALLAWSWPGNVRELSNVMERAALLSPTSEITAEQLALRVAAAPGPAAPAPEAPLREAVGSVERQRLIDVLSATGWNVSHAAARLGMSRSSLRYRIDKHGLRPGVPRAVPRGAAPSAPPAPSVVPGSPSRPSSSAPASWSPRHLALLRLVLALPPLADTPAAGGRALALVLDKVGSFGGRVEERGPTGIVAVFGIEPTEDALGHAAHTALAVQAALARGRRDGTDAATARIGIHGASILVGGTGERAELDLDGKRQAWALLEELVARAPAAGTLVSEPGARLLRRRFRLEGTTQPDSPGPGPIFRLAGLEPTAFGLAGRMTSFVGRRPDLELLRSRLDGLLQGHGHVVSIVGEAGIGKSRLLFEFRRNLPATEVVFYEARCLSHGHATPYLPILELLRASLGLAEADDREAMAAGVRTGLHELGLSPDAAPYLLTLLDVSAGIEGAETPGPQVVRSRTVEILTHIALRDSRRHPLVVAIEDLHWIDRTSEEVIASLIEGLAAAPILWVFTHRPGYQAPWTHRSYATQVALQPLPTEESLAVIRSVLGTEVVPEPLAQAILARAGGNPFCLEELALATQETGDLQATAAIPDTIQAVLATRIERLPETPQRLLQTAAVLGPAFPLRLLRAMWVGPEPLEPAMQELMRLELLRQEDGGEEPLYAFKHVLTHEVAYRSLPTAERRALHAAAARALESLSGDVPVPPERLAHHYTEADLTAQAMPCWERAGQQALRRSAYPEAIGHLGRGLALLEHLPDAPERRRRELDLLTTLGAALVAVQGFGAAEVARVYGRALDLSRQVGDTPELFRALRGLWEFYELRGDLRRAQEIAEQLLGLARRAADPALQLVSHNVLGDTLVWLGEFAAARDHLDRGVALYDRERHHPLTFVQGGYDPGVHCRVFLAHALWYLGYPDQALVRVQEAIALSRAISHPFSEALALMFAAWLHQYRREPRLAEQQAAAALTLAAQHDLRFVTAVGTALRGWALAAQGRSVDGVAEIRRGLATYRATGAELERPHWLVLLAEAVGDPAAGLGHLTEALAIVEERQTRFCEAELHRLRGALLLNSPAPDAAEAESCFRQALEVARRQQARCPELRAAVSLGRLWARQGRREEARRVVSEVYGWFSEGVGVADLADAEALLEELER